jgi:phospholipase C
MAAWWERLRTSLRRTFGGTEPQPDRALDRWLLVLVRDVGPWTGAQFAEASEVRGAGPEDPRRGPALARLTERQAAQWIEGAYNRGLLETRATRLSGSALAPPQAVLTHAGLLRLQELHPRIGPVRRVIRFVRRSRLAHRERERWEQAVAAMPDLPLSIEPARPLRPGERSIQPFEPPSEDEALARLERIEHIVVVMMENRSFDHMLGYLRLWGHEHVEGLNGDEAQRWQGTDYGVKHLGDTRLPKVADPCHSADCVEEQLDEDLGGFPGNFERQRRLDPGYVMGYYTGDDLPVYDHLARHFCVCDHWFSSIPGATWPNRLFALAGCQDGTREGLFDRGELFDLSSFVRKLPDDVDSWRWYSHDPATLRLADGRFRPHLEDGEWRDPYREHFRFFDRRAVSEVMQSAGRLIVDERSSFLDDARENRLASVSWIDPNFVDLSVRDPSFADDHPPSDVLAGQAFVLDVYRALVRSKAWPSTMLVIVYDEHGGFYDHCKPPALGNGAGTYGVRVPALVASPHVAEGVVSKVQFEHTSLTRTILERFGPAGAVEEMPARVRTAPHLGFLLAEEPRDEPPDLLALEARMAERRAARPGPATRREDDRPELADFAAEVAQGAVHLRANGLPAAHP